MNNQQKFLWIVLALFVIAVVLYVGKTTLTKEGISMERPWTAFTLLISIVCRLLEE